MTVSPDPQPDFHSDLRLLTRDLESVSGTLEEIATVWRRAHQYRPDLPVGLPLRLEDATRELAGTVDDLARAVPGQRPRLGSLMTAQICALERGAAAVQAMTCSAGTPPSGDAGLWGNLDAAMERVRARALSLVLQLPEAADQPVAGRRDIITARAAAPRPR